MGWSISPGDATIDATSGKATFPCNSGSSKTYTITYSDGDCTQTYSVTLKGGCTTCGECKCQPGNDNIVSFGDPTPYGTSENPVPASGGTVTIPFTAASECMSFVYDEVYTRAGKADWMPKENCSVVDNNKLVYVVPANTEKTSRMFDGQVQVLNVKTAAGATDNDCWNNVPGISQKGTSTVCDPAPVFSFECNDEGKPIYYVTPGVSCDVAVINWTLTDSQGHTSSQGTDISQVPKHGPVPFHDCVPGNVTVRWWAVEDNEVSGSTTIQCPDCKGDCDCSGISLSYGSTTLAASGESKEFTAGTTPADCISKIKFTPTEDWIKVSSIVDGKFTISGTSNTSTSERSGTVKVYLDEVECTVKNITVKQEGSGGACASLNLTSKGTWDTSSVDLPDTIGGGGYVRDYTVDFTEDVSVSADKEWINASLDTSTKTISISPKSDNTSCAERTGTVTIKVGEDTCTTISVKQSGGNKTITLKKDPESLTCSGGTVTFTPE